MGICQGLQFAGVSQSGQGTAFPWMGWGFWRHAGCGVSCQAVVPDLTY